MTSGRDQKELTGVSLLGNKTKYPTDYAPEVLEAFINKHPGNDYFENLTARNLQACADDRTAGFCCDLYFLCA